MSPSGLSSNVRTAMGDATSRRLGSPNQAMTGEQIEQMMGYFAAAARRCAEAGPISSRFHAGHGYLLSDSLTPLFNRREDEYGGSFENRTQMLLRVIRAVRKAVGDDIAVGLKYNGSDFLGDQGWTIEDSCRLAPLAEEAGVDYITITAGLVGTPQLTIPPMYEPQGCYSDLAAAVRPFAKVPIGTIGRIKNPLMARDLVAEGKADFVCLGRSTIADPDFFGKVRRGALQEIRPCLADCRGCIDEHLDAIQFAPHSRVHDAARIPATRMPMQPIPGLGISNTVRGAVAGWSKTLANEVALLGVTVNIILPGRFDTNRVRDLDGNRAKAEGISRDQVKAEVVRGIPVGRYGDADEFGAVVAFVASRHAAYLTGSMLRVDGGGIRSL